MLGFFVYRFILSLTSCKSCMAIDDQLNILPISSHTLNITALPTKSKVNFLFIAYTHSPLWSWGGGGFEWETSSNNYFEQFCYIFKLLYKWVLQFQRTGLDTVEVMKEMFLISNWNIYSIFTDTILKPHRFENFKSHLLWIQSAVNNRVRAPVLKALSDCTKFCCIVAALFALQ